MSFDMKIFYHTCIVCQGKAIKDIHKTWTDNFGFLDMAECKTLENPPASDDFNFTLMNGSLGNTTLYQNLTFQEPIAHQNVDRLKFIAYGVLSSVIIGLGILGNISNLIVLTRPNLKGVTFVYLTWLAISDLMALLVSLTSMFRLHGMQPRTYAAAVYYSYIEMPLVNSFMASSVFLVVALTIERYFSVCLPTRFKEIHNSKRARCSIVSAYVVAFLLYIPVCFQKRPVMIPHTNGTQFIACDNPSVANNTVFTIYIFVKEVIVRLGPVLILAVLNITIIVTFRKTMKKKRAMLSMSAANSGSQYNRENNRRYREEQRLIILLAGIVILFFLSMTPAAILTILNSDDREYHFEFQLFRAFANVLELSNYAMNFYVYCMCSSEIRRTFVALATCTKPAPNINSGSSKPSVESNNKF